MNLEVNNNEIKLSILCITYNQASFIEQAISGFLQQEADFKFEIVIHDDASDDGTDKIVKKYQEQYPNLIYAILEKENQYSLGKHIIQMCLDKYCRGKYVAYCEGDDYWIDPLKISKQVKYLDAHPECSLIYHPVYYVFNEKIESDDKHWEEERTIKTEELIHGGGLFCASPSLVFRKDRSLPVEHFREMADIEDFPLQIQLALNGQVYYLPNIMACYRRNAPQSWTSRVLSKNNEKTIKHWWNEIAWLSEANKKTNGVYADEFEFRITTAKYYLYQLKQINRKEMFRAVRKLRGFNNKKEIIKKIWAWYAGDVKRMIKKVIRL